MPSRQSVPRIRVNLPDGSSCDLSPSSTLDMKDVLRQVKLLPKLLAEVLVFDEADDTLYFEVGGLQNFPSFPMGRSPSLFILNSHRARLPFPIRPDAFELGDFCRDEEDACPLLTAPTIPRMKMMMKEPLYVQKWVDTLTSDNPPDHIPWTCDKSVTKKKWIAQGSVFPVDVVKADRILAERRRTTQERACVTNVGKFSTLANQGPPSRELCAHSRASIPIYACTESYASTAHVRTNSADVDPGVFRGEPKMPLTPRHIVTTSQVPSTPTLFSSGSTFGTTSSVPYAPLAARRGKSLSGLKLKGNVIEHLEYPDIPTAFRGSSIVWSPRFDTFPVPSCTGHESMLLDLKSKCTALGSGLSPYIHEPLRPQSKPVRTSLSVDEWPFTQGLAINNSFLRSINGEVPAEIVTNSSTPVKSPSFTMRLGFVSHLHSAFALQSPRNRSSDPPGVPLPPRPALINSSTPPYVRGILKKVKSVRFEDMTIEEFDNHTLPVATTLQVPSECLALSPASISERPCTPMPNATKLPSGPAPVKTAHGKNIQKVATHKSRLPPKRAQVNGKRVPTSFDTGNAPKTPKPTLATTSTERPCRISRAKENTNPAAVPRVLANQTGLSITEIDIRRGIEGTTKNRLSTPLRNIFRFR